MNRKRKRITPLSKSERRRKKQKKIEFSNKEIQVGQLSWRVRFTIRNDFLSSDFIKFLVSFEMANVNDDEKSITTMLRNIKSPNYVISLIMMMESNWHRYVRRKIYYRLVKFMERATGINAFYHEIFGYILECKNFDFDRIGFYIKAATKSFRAGHSFPVCLSLFVSDGTSSDLDGDSIYTQESLIKMVPSLDASRARCIINRLLLCVTEIDDNLGPLLCFSLDKEYKYEMKIIFKKFIEFMIGWYSYEVVLTRTLFLEYKWLWNTFRKHGVPVEFFRECLCTTEYQQFPNTHRILVWGIKEAESYSHFLEIGGLLHLLPELWEIVYEYY